MPARISQTQEQLNEALEDIGRVQEILQEAYTPEASREIMAAAVGQALEVLADYEDEESDDSDDEDAA